MSNYLDDNHSLEMLDLQDFYQNFEREKKRLEDQTRLQIANRLICKHDGLDLSAPWFKPYDDPDFELPPKQAVRTVIKLVLARGYNKTQISDCLGVSKTGSNRVINYWLSEDSDRHVNKSNWILLTIMAGIAIPDQLAYLSK